MNVLISACLLGQYCRYDGQTKVYPQVQDLLGRDDIHLIPVCPEQAGGLATPRPAWCRSGPGLGPPVPLHEGHLEREKSVLWTWTDLRWYFFTDPDGWRRRDGGVITRRRP